MLHSTFVRRICSAIQGILSGLRLGISDVMLRDFLLGCINKAQNVIRELQRRFPLVKIFGGPRRCCYSKPPQTRDLTTLVTLCYICLPIQSRTESECMFAYGRELWKNQNDKKNWALNTTSLRLVVRKWKLQRDYGLCFFNPFTFHAHLRHYYQYIVFPC